MRLAPPLAVLFLLASCTAADDSVDAGEPTGLATTVEARKLCDATVDKVAVDDVEGAFALVDPVWTEGQNKSKAWLHHPWGPAEFAEVRETRFVDHQFVQDAVVQYHYEMESERGVQHFTCVFARQGEAWELERIAWAKLQIVAR
jgi:hypothetical protein